MNYEIRTVDLKEQPTLVVRRKARISEVGQILARDLPKIFRYITETGGQIAGAPFTRDLSFENGVFEFEAGLPVASPMPGTEEFVPSKLDGGRFATTSHFGAYERLSDAHAAIVAWLKANAMPVQFPRWDQYVSDPAATTPDKVETRIFYPIG
jgi:effector-binding domain-containing protein